jgi:2-polyprenyl-3-methyl-5-hydroxy-6-metoxy-1,4-benzoquinol methylase
METIECIFCPGEKTTIYREENGYVAVRCSRCGLVFVNPRPTIEEMKQLYEGQETKINLLDHLQKRDLKCGQAKESLRWIGRYCRTGKLLEIGSAAGYFLWEAKKAGFDVTGVDLTHQFVEFSNRVLNVPAFEGTLRDAPLEKGSFEIIYMRNVLSHLAHPIEEFTFLGSLLKPGGYLVLETGNVAELDPTVPSELELPDHLFHFSAQTIRMLFEKTGFLVKDIHRFALLSELRTIKFLGNRFHKKRHANGASKSEFEIPTALPASHFGSRIAAEIGNFIRYDLGRVFPSSNRRCTLIGVGMKPNE